MTTSRGAFSKLIAAAFATVAALGFAPASAAPATSRSLAVSVPPEPTTILPGGTAVIPLRVLNPGSSPVTVTITGRGVDLGDNGEMTLAAGLDPRWQGRVGFPTAPLTIAAQGFIDVKLPVQMPSVIAPDLYFVGFLVTPLKAVQGDVQVINQIGSFVTVDVPGPRLRALTADLNLPGFTLGNDVHGTLHVRNIGPAAARFWGENDVTSAPGGSLPSQQRIEKSTLPTGRVRSFDVSGAPRWLLGFVTMRVRIDYPDQTETATKEILITRRVFVMSPWLLVIVGSLLVAGLSWWVHHRRQRRPVPAPVVTTQAMRRRLLYQGS